MPQIKQYTPEADVAGAPQSRRVYTEDLSLGRAIQGLGKEIGETSDVIYKRQEQKEVADLTTKMSEKDAEYTVALQEKLKSADPNDPNYDKLTQNFIDSWDKDVSKLQEGITTNGARQYFNRENAQTRSHFVKYAAATQAELAGAKVVQDYRKTVDNMSTTVATDPQSFDRIQQKHNEAIDGWVKSGKLPANKAEEFKRVGTETLAKAAVMGTIRKNPYDAKAQIDSGAWDKSISGEDKLSLLSKADERIRSKELDSERSLRLEEKAKKIKQEEVYNTLLQDQIDGTLTAQKVVDADIDPLQKRPFLNALKKSIVNPKFLETNPVKYNDTFERVNLLPDSDPRKIMNEEQLNREYMRGGMSERDLKFFRNELQKNKTPEGKRENTMKSSAINMVKETIKRTSGPKDPRAPEMFLGFQQEYWKAYDDGIKAGKSPQELTSPEFVMSVARPFIRTPQAKISDRATKLKTFKQKAGGQSDDAIFNKMNAILKKKNL